MKNPFNFLLKITGVVFCILILHSGCTKEIPAVENSEVNDVLKSSSAEELSLLATTPGYYAIATYNVRRTTTADVGQRAWSVRRPLVKDMILKYSFDIFGVQEPMGPQVANMSTDLPAYSKIGVSDHDDVAYQHQDIFYKTAKFTLKSQGKFWMAPGGPTSVPTDTTPWDSYYHACVCTWGKFQDKTTGREFFVFNTHFDPGSPDGVTPVVTGMQARYESGKVMLNKVESIAGGLPSIVMGDLNSNQYTDPNNDKPYHYLDNSTLLDETYNVASVKAPASRQTGNWWNINPTGNSQIDHIFVSMESHNTWDVLSRTVLWDHYDGVGSYNDVLPSDHFPVMSEMKLPAPAAPLATGKYRIMAQNSGKALVVLNAALTNSAKVVQLTYTAATPTNDEWNFTKIGTTGYYRISNVNSGRDMNVQGQSVANSAQIIQYGYTADQLYNDEWFLIDAGGGFYRIVSRHSGLSLNIQGNTTADNANVIQYKYTAGAANSHFQMISVP